MLNGKTEGSTVTDTSATVSPIVAQSATPTLDVFRTDFFVESDPGVEILALHNRGMNTE